MTENRHIKISVRLLVETTMLSGSITSLSFGESKTLEGTLGHKYVQSLRVEGYTPEVSLSHTVNCKGLTIEVGGRIDGVLILENFVVIEEIKTTDIPLEYIKEDSFVLHWAQAKIYAYVYALQNHLDSIGVRITYLNRETKGLVSFDSTFSITSLEDFFYEVLYSFADWENMMLSWQHIRNGKLREIDFPFNEYRRGQKSFVTEVYKTICEGRRLFAQAPTGIGKTLAAIFPSLKSMCNGFASKVFYLTAKTITRTVAENALALLYENGMRLKVVTITAKEKICFCPDIYCIPEKCDYAKGYYDRLREGIRDIFSVDCWFRDSIEKYAREHKLCPFEFSLDLSLYADFVICDYNYVFDPRVRLKRFFMDGKTDFVFLIDEAHNLVDRGREMYSAQLNKSSILKMMKLTKKYDSKLTKSLKAINQYFINIRRMLEHEDKNFDIINQKHIESELIPLLLNLMNLAQIRLSKKDLIEGKDELANLYFEVLKFVNTCEVYDERFITYVEEKDKDLFITLFCIDPSYLLRKCLDQGIAAIMFSATLTPIVYFRSILGGSESDDAVMLTSPFPQENLCLLAAHDVSTKYVSREFSYEIVAEYIHSIVCARGGNYIAYFPSYKYMSAVYNVFTENYKGIPTIIQSSGMGEQEKANFLEQFESVSGVSLVGFAVMGGIFGEGIDLVGDRLQGAIIVGVGLPQICPERDIIREYYQKTDKMGFEFAYVYPGMNRVMQAAGRVIRTETDKGVVLLIDERFAQTKYKRLFPRHWSKIKFIDSPEQVSSIWGDFIR